MVCCGARSKLEIGMPPQRYDLAVDLTGMVQIPHYDPADLTLSVDAGLPLAELTKVLAAQNQFLPLAVPCFGSSTIGGLSLPAWIPRCACNMARRAIC